MSVYDILADIQAHGGRGRAYGEKQLHKVPQAKVVKRHDFILERCAGRSVLDIGYASGDLHGRICEVAKEAYGIDRASNGQTGDHYVQTDLDGFDVDLPSFPGSSIDLILCGEVLEHLSNPGWLLWRIANSFPFADLLITVPNAFSSVGQHSIRGGIENVNIDHAYWFSWRTLKTLVERFGFFVAEFHWYHGEPLVAEGIVFFCNGPSVGPGNVAGVGDAQVIQPASGIPENT